MGRKTFSEILTIQSEFNFFKAAAYLEPFDLLRLESLTDDLLNYSARVRETFTQLRYFNETNLDTEWISEGKGKFQDICRNVESIDSIVLQALNLLECKLEEENMAETTIFDKLDMLGEANLEIKEYLLPWKTKLDVCIEYNDIYNLTMNSINTELENCLKKCFKIHEKRFSSPVRHAPSFNLEILTKKLLHQRNQLRLPLLNEVDNELYQEYLALKTIVDPLKASLSFIPIRIEDFRNKYEASNLADTTKMKNKYDALVKEMQYLQNEVNDLKYELVDKRWSEIFSYLNTEMSFLITNVEKEVTKMQQLEDDSIFKSQVFKRLRYTTNIVENTFILINQAIDEELMHVKVMEKSNELAESWLTVKGKIPYEYISKIDDEEDEEDEEEKEERNDNGADGITKSFRKLALDQGARRVSQEDKDAESKRDKRKSRYGQFLFNKMNLKAVIIESDPTSVKKPEDLNTQKVLGDSAKHNKLDITPSKSKDPNSITDLKKIPDLKSALANRGSSSSSIRTSGSSVISAHSFTSMASPDKQLSEEPESPVSVKKEVHEETLDHLLHGSPNVFETPAPISKRHASDSSAILTQSKIPILASLTKQGTPENSKSRIPRPVSRVNIERPLSRLTSQHHLIDRPLPRESLIPRSLSSLGTRTLQRPSTSLSLSRSVKTENLTTRAGLSHRHSIIPQTPVRGPIAGKRRSMIPQPTPIKEFAERSTSRRSGTRNSLQSGSSLGDRMGAPPPKPIWR